MSKNYTIALGLSSLAVAAVVAGVGISNHALASTTGQTSLVDKIASTFNLKKEDVQKVFDQERTEHEAERETHYEARLTAAVKEGKLTEAQKTKILEKHKQMLTEMKANREAMQNKTEAERKASMEAKRAEITKWESDNGIPSGYLMMHPKGGPGRGHARGPGADFGPPPAN